MTCDSVDLPEPFGPMIACTSPLFTLIDSPWRISRSSTRTFRSLTSSNAIILFQILFHVLLTSPERRLRRVPSDRASADAALKRDRNQLLRLHRELHRELLQHVLDKAVDDEADGLLLAQPALDAVEQHVLGDLRRRRLVLEGRR